MDFILPMGGLVLAQGYLYGTASRGGSMGEGGLFRIKPDGSDYEVMKNFDRPPTGGVVQIGDKLYGTVLPEAYETSDEFGLLYSFDLITGDLNTVKIFMGEGVGLYPVGTPVVKNGSILGATMRGGMEGGGTLYSYTPVLNRFRIVYSFPFLEGLFPNSSLSIMGDTVFGYFGGTYAAYSYDLRQLNLTILFTPVPGTSFGDKFGPHSGPLAISDPILGEKLFCTTTSGGDGRFGALFQVDLKRSSADHLHSFTKPVGFMNGDPTRTQLIFDRGAVYGVSIYDGNSRKGTLYKFAPN